MDIAIRVFDGKRISIERK